MLKVLDQRRVGSETKGQDAGGLEKPVEILELATKVVAAYVKDNPVPLSVFPGLVTTVHQMLCGLQPTPRPAATHPPVEIPQSVTPEYLVCLEDGKKVVMLKRYLKSRYRMSPEEYRSKWGLPADYPMVAPNCSDKLSARAKKTGLGHIPTGRPGEERLTLKKTTDFQRYAQSRTSRARRGIGAAIPPSPATVSQR